MGHQPTVICPWCGRPTIVIYVHGEGRCQYCHNVIEPCCEGECATPPGHNGKIETPDDRRRKRRKTSP